MHTQDLTPSVSEDVCTKSSFVLEDFLLQRAFVHLRFISHLKHCDPKILHSIFFHFQCYCGSE